MAVKIFYMAKNYQYKFPYNACFAGTIEHITSLYVWKQRVIEALERFRRELPHGDAFYDISLRNELHLDYSIEMIEFLHSELLASGYYSSLNCPTAQRPNELIEIKVRGKLPNNASTNGPNTGVFRLHF